MPQFGERSARALETAHPDLQRLFVEVIKYYDCSVLEGHRGQVAQEEAVAKGLSKTHWPDSKHNKVVQAAEKKSAREAKDDEIIQQENEMRRELDQGRIPLATRLRMTAD